MKSTEHIERAADADKDVPLSSIGPDDPADGMMAVAEVDADAIEDGQIRAGRLAGKSMWAAIWILSLPILLQQLMAACVGLVDKILAGHLPGKVVVPAMDGIGVGTYVGWFTGIALAGLGVGGQAIIARSMGSGNKKDAHDALGASVTLGVVWGAFVGVIMWLLAAPLAAISGLTPEASAHCTTYVTVIAWSMPFCGVMTVGGLCLHGAGETAKPSWISIGINVINLVASWMLSGVVIRYGEHTVPAPLSINPETWGVWGIAAGTSLSYIAGGIATVWVMAAGVKDLRLEKSALKPTRKIMWRIARLGIPNFFEGLAMWGASLFLMGFIGDIARGATGLEPRQGLIGAHMITVQWEAFSFLPGFAMGTAAGALAGQYLGARNPQMARKAIWACTFIGMILMGSMGIIFITQGRVLASIISDQAVHLEEVPKLLLACGVVQVFFALCMTVRQGLRGVGDVKWILGITVGSIYLLRLPLAWALGVWMGYGLAGIWWGLSIEMAVRGLLFLARFHYGNWQKLRV